MKNRSKILMLILCITSILFCGFKANAEEAAEKTVIDVTDLFTGDVVSHDCSLYLGTKYDGSNHWQECTLCKKKIDITPHSYTSYWTMGDSCSPNNMYKHICSCGYFYNTANTRAHYGNAVLSYDSIRHMTYCSVCNTQLSTGDHYNSHGYIGCRSGVTGTCSYCGQTISAVTHSGYGNYNFISNTYTLTGCSACSKNPFYNISGSISYSGTSFNMLICIPYNGAYGTIQNYSTYLHDFPDVNTGVVTGYSCYLAGNTIVYNITGYSTVVDAYNYVTFGFLIKTTSGHTFSSTWGVNFKPEIIAPIISNITEEDLAVNGDWVTAKQLTISGTENHCWSVKLSMTDNKGNNYLNNVSVPVYGGNWSYMFIPEIECDEKGMEFTITVEDALGNKATKKVIFYNTDKKTPTIVSDKETEAEWSKTKDWLFDTTDYGARNVELSFNDIDNYVLPVQDGDNFSKQYRFTGDVYGSTVAAIYAKDGLGNTKTEFLTIYNLDNTAPTITDAEKEIDAGRTNMKVTVSANDINEKLGASGSGITGYSITKSADVPETWQESNTFSFTENGTYYIWAKDLVENISEPYELSITEFTAPVIYKDVVDSIDGEILYEWEPVDIKIGQIVSGADKGEPDIPNSPYNGYQYSHSVSFPVVEGLNIVYRIFTIPKVTVSGSVLWNDNSNRYETRPSDVTVYLYRDGELIGYVTGLVSENVNNYSFPDLQKYSFEDGHEYEYTVSQSKVISLKEPEDKYASSVVGYDIINRLVNTDADKPVPDPDNPDNPDNPNDPDNPDNKGYYIEGNIYWEDNEDLLGFRPSEVVITLYQKGEDGEWVIFDSSVVNVDSGNKGIEGANYYLFDWLPKYWYDLNDVPVSYEYKVEETFTAWYVDNGVIKNAYTIIPDTPNECEFTNTFNFPDGAVIPVNEHNNTLSIKTNTDKQVEIILKPLELFIDIDYSVSYGDSTGDNLNIFADKNGAIVDKLISTRYEIVNNDPDFVLEDIVFTGDNMILENIDGKWYITILNTPEDAVGSITVNLREKETGYKDRQRRNNYFAVSYAAAVDLLELHISDVTDIQMAPVKNIAIEMPDIDENISEKESINLTTNSVFD